MNIKHPILILFLLAVAISSCVDEPEANNDWKIQNEQAFTSWKDSVGMLSYEVPANRGGGTLLYRKIRTVESGRSPLFTDSVVVHYKGMYHSGTIFDGTYRKAEPDEYEIDKPAGFGVSSLIRGWSEGLQLMKEGEKFLFVIPSELGYGTTGDRIPAFSTLVFEVDLLKVIPKK